jgi:hypothetical protein
MKMSDEEELYYVHYIDQDGKHFDRGRLFVRPYVGQIIERNVHEGIVPWEVTKIEDPGTKVWNDRPLLRLTIKKLEYFQTHCHHEWVNRISATTLQFPERKCSKCSQEEHYDYVPCKWRVIKEGIINVKKSFGC